MPAEVSIVLEWETGAECGGDRAARGLARIAAEAAAHGRAEIIVVVDPGEGAGAVGAVESLPGEARARVVEAPAPLGYYEKKNFGFGASSGAIVAFVDSDLLVEPGWLGALLAPFTQPGCSAVVGRTHFETATRYERAMALFWIFDARVEADEVRGTGRLVSNNIAFRRPLFAALPFPPRPTYRNQCAELGRTLAGLGIPLYEATAARAVHPAPAGLRAFVTRAVHSGRDARLTAGGTGRGGQAAARAEWRADRARVRRRIAERAPLLHSGRADRIAAFGLGFLYYAVKAAAYGVASAVPPSTPAGAAAA